MAAKIVPINSELDPDSFLVSASDAKGRSERIQARIVPEEDREISIFLASNKLPYQTRGDLIRHAIHRHLKWLHSVVDLGEEGRTLRRQCDAMLEIVRAERMRREWFNIFTALEEEITYLLSRNGLSEARRIIVTVRSSIDMMPEGYWKDQYRDELMSKYGGFFRV